MPNKFIHVRGLLNKISSSRIPFKPYNYEIGFDSDSGRRVYVEMDIPAEYVVQQDQPEFIVINLDGLNALLEIAADAQDKLDVQYKKKIGGK